MTLFKVGKENIPAEIQCKCHKKAFYGRDTVTSSEEKQKCRSTDTPAVHST